MLIALDVVSVSLVIIVRLLLLLYLQASLCSVPAIIINDVGHCNFQHCLWCGSVALHICGGVTLNTDSSGREACGSTIGSPRLSLPMLTQWSLSSI